MGLEQATWHQYLPIIIEEAMLPSHRQASSLKMHISLDPGFNC